MDLSNTKPIQTQFYSKEKEEENQKFQIKKNSDEWRSVEFHLKSTIQNDVDMKRVTKIITNHSKTEFDKKSKDKLTCYTWIQSSLLSQKNSISNLRQRGKFDISSIGLDFLYGCLFDDNSNIDTENEFILCKSIIGLSFCKILKDKNELNSFNIESNIKSLLPEGYDSIMFCPPNIFNQNLTILQTSSKKIRYRIFDNDNVIPLYLVEFIRLNLYTIKSNKVLCDECDNNKNADVYCKDCFFNFCKDCFDNIHLAQVNEKLLYKINYKEHKSIKLSKKTNSGLCDCLKQKEVEYFCEECKVSLCSYCKIIGSHSKKEYSSHRLRGIDEVYHEKNIDNNDQIIKSINVKQSLAYDQMNLIKSKLILLKGSLYENTKTDMERHSEKVYKEIQLEITEEIEFYLKRIDLLKILRDLIKYNDLYFQSRLLSLKNVYPSEFVYTWSMFLNIINGLGRSLVLLSKSTVDFDKKTMVAEKVNEFYVNSYCFDDKNNKKVKQKEKSTIKINSVSTKFNFDYQQYETNRSNPKVLKMVIKKNDFEKEIKEIRVIEEQKNEDFN